MVSNGRYGSISRLFTASMKNLFNFSATFALSEYMIPSSIIIMFFSRSFCLSENKGFTLCQNFLLSLNTLKSRLL